MPGLDLQVPLLLSMKSSEGDGEFQQCLPLLRGDNWEMRSSPNVPVNFLCRTRHNTEGGAGWRKTFIWDLGLLLSHVQRYSEKLYFACYSSSDKARPTQRFIECDNGLQLGFWTWISTNCTLSMEMQFGRPWFWIPRDSVAQGWTTLHWLWFSGMSAGCELQQERLK